jgi:hypothetical protein
MDGLERLRLIDLSAADRPDEHGSGLLEPTESVEVTVQVIRREIDRALVTATLLERAADIDADDERRSRDACAVRRGHAGNEPDERYGQGDPA